MARPVTLFTGQWADLPLETLAQKAKEWGYDGLELACWGDHFDVHRGAEDKVYCQGRHDLLAKYGLKCWAISNHLAGQLVCDLNDSRSEAFAPKEVHGDPDMRIRLIQVTPMDFEGQSLSVSGRITPKFSDPLEERSIVVTLTEFVLPAPGRYEVVLESDGTLIGKRKFEAHRENDVGASSATARKSRFAE